MTSNGERKLVGHANFVRSNPMSDRYQVQVAVGTSNCVVDLR